MPAPTWQDNGIPVTNALRILEAAIIDYEGGRANLHRWVRILQAEIHNALPGNNEVAKLTLGLTDAIHIGTQPHMMIMAECLHAQLNKELVTHGITFVESDVVPSQTGESGGGK